MSRGAQTFCATPLVATTTSETSPSQRQTLPARCVAAALSPPNVCPVWPEIPKHLHGECIQYSIAWLFEAVLIVDSQFMSKGSATE
jgi:hypothetical protein